jgi:AraC family transcriptional regulator
MPTQPPPDPYESSATRGLEFCRSAASTAAPRYLESDIIAPHHVVALDASTSLKASYWHATVEETVQQGDLDFVSIALNLGGGRVFRNSESVATDVGTVAMQPFEGARWRFEQPVSFVHLYLPFRLVAGVCESLFERELDPTSLRMPVGLTDGVCRAAQLIQARLASIEPTHLILDSWAMVLAELLVLRLSSHAHRRAHVSLGKIPGRAVARVVDYIEASIDQDLRLAALASVGGMSSYHFARRFKATVGMTPHAYVLARRVRRAQELLKSGAGNLADVAAACGFSSQAHLTTAFVTTFDVTPCKYRQSISPKRHFGSA